MRIHVKRLARCIGAAALLLAARGAAAEAPVPTLRAGVARADITPDPAVLNWITGKPYGRVLDPLFVQVLLLDDGTRRVAILRWDLVDVSESARDEARRVLREVAGVAEDHVLVHASHTHSAPWAPTYREGYRGRERDTWWSIRYQPAQDGHEPYRRWKEKLREGIAAAARTAVAGLQPVSLSIGRISVAEYLYNRRRRLPTWGLADPTAKSVLINGRGEWIPEVLLAGSTFGPMDRTFTLVFFRDAADRAVASLYHVACHAVAIYPEDADRISADWPGAATPRLAAALGGEALFLQGCAGDITPSWPRGVEATARAAEGLTRRAETAARFQARLVPGPLTAARRTLALPLTPEARERLGRDTVDAEVQVIACGPLAFVGLPGEPLTDLGTQIREASPFPQTLVLGYANGNGVHYVGLPGEKARGGYEAGRAGAGTDECGTLLIQAATALLADMVGQARGPAPTRR